MEILIISNNLKYGGAERQSVYLANILSKYYKVHYVIWDKKLSDNQFYNFIKQNVDNIFLLNGKNSVQKILEVNSLVKNLDSPVVISYLATTNVLNGIIKLLNSSVISIGGIRNQIIKSKFKLIIQRYVHNYLLDCTISNNASVISYLTEKKFNLNTISVIRNCVFLPKNGYSESCKDEISIVTIGRLEKQKDLYTAINAIKELSKYKLERKFHYKIIGDGSLYNKLTEKVNKLGLHKFCSFIPNANVNNAFKEADIYLSTSIIEGTSNSILEALAYGLPVIATDAGDNKYMIKQGVNGYLHKVGDYISISKSLETLINNIDLLREFGEQSKNIAVNDFSPQKFEKEYLKLISQLRK